MNAAYSAEGRNGGFYDLADAAAVDPEIAKSSLDRKEFIFDVQGHFVNPDGAGLKQLPPDAKPLSFFEKSGCALADQPGQRSYLQCLSSDEFIKDVFPRFGHRHDGAVFRALAPRCGTADHRGGRRDRGHRRTHGRHASAAD
ncbi:MAG: hypothetical protein M3Q32_05730, partial [Pseudomonadota bacterium]|nr:hypothetical protein [Pseudomonadota bacterium]